MQRTEHIFPNALVSTPHPNVAIMKKCQVLPVEVVVRGFMTGKLCRKVCSQLSVCQLLPMLLPLGQLTTTKSAHWHRFILQNLQRSLMQSCPYFICHHPEMSQANTICDVRSKR